MRQYAVVFDVALLMVVGVVVVCVCGGGGRGGGVETEGVIFLYLQIFVHLLKTKFL